MTPAAPAGREAITHYQVRSGIASVFGKFTLLEVKIDTGRTHQIGCICRRSDIRVGDALYGARATELRRIACFGKRGRTGSLWRATSCTPRQLELHHPRTGETAPLRQNSPELQVFVKKVGRLACRIRSDQRDGGRFPRARLRCALRI